MDDALLITSFRHLEIDGRIDQYVRLLPGLNITNDENVKRNLLTPGLLQGIGAIEYDFLRKAPNVVYYEYVKGDFRSLGVVEPEPFLLAVMMWIEALFRNAWLIKDHRMECDAAFLYIDRTSQEASWSSNYLPIRPTFADGAPRTPIRMSVDELKIWVEKSDHIEAYLGKKQSSSYQFMMQKGFSRTGRAMQFISAARNAPDLAFKIAHYCSALEALFTTDTNELAHKLSERVAFFLGSHGYSRSTVFRDVKGAYAVRSKLSHGDVLRPRQAEELPNISQTIDKYLREIMNILFFNEELLAIFDSHNQRIEEHFHELIFGDQ